MDMIHDKCKFSNSFPYFEHMLLIEAITMCPYNK